MPHDAMQIGLVVIFGLILLPVYVMAVGWLVGKPRELRPVGVATAYVVLLSVVIIFGLWVLGQLTGIVITY